MADLIVFDIFSDFAHFKRPYTTTSPITFPIPSKPTLYGMVAAIIGIDKNHYLEKFYNCGVRVGIKIKNPVHKIYLAENLINTKDGMAKIKTRTQIKIEFLKDAAYRIYFYHPDKKVSKPLLKNLKEHKSHYTFSLGLSECIGNFSFMGKYESIHKDNLSNNGFIDIHSILPTNSLLPEEENTIKFEPDREIFRVSLTGEMNPEREIQKMMDAVFERKGRPIKAKVKNYEEIAELGENILLF